MSRRLDEDDEELLPARHNEREVTLGTGAILAIFFGLVALVGASIGFGYKLGSGARNTAATLPADSPAPVTAATSANFNAFKPAAGSPIGSSSSTAPGIVVHDGSAPLLPVPTGTPARGSTPPASTAPDAEPQASTSRAQLALAQSTPLPTPPPEAAPMPATSVSGSFVVQVAAVSHQEDRDLLVNALHAKGYNVTARSESGDSLVHIQVGPFSSRKDAEAMKARLTADGYNAFIK